MSKGKKITYISLSICILSFLGLLAFNTLPVFAVTLDNPLGQDDPRVIIGYIINAILGIVGSLALIVFIYGGLIWLTSQGNEQRVEQGKKLIVWAALGLVVIFTSYALVMFVLKAVGAVGTEGGDTTTSGDVTTSPD